MSVRTNTSTGTLAPARAFVVRHPLVTVLVVSLLARAVVAAGIATFFGGSLFSDDVTYHQIAGEMASGQTQRWNARTHFLYESTGTFVVPLTMLYRVFGPVTLIGQLYVALFGAATAVLTARLAMEVLDRRWALVAGFVIAFLPSQVLFSSLILKDAAVWALMAVLSLLAARAASQTGRKLVALAVLTVVLLVAMRYLRQHTLIVACWALVLAALFSSAQAWKARVAGALVIAVSLPWVLGLGPAGLGTATAAAGSLEERRENNALGANSAIVAVEAPAAVKAGGAAPTGAGEAGGGAGDASSGGGGGAPTTPTAPKQDSGAAFESAPTAAPAAKPAADAGFSANARHLPTGLVALLARPFPWSPGSSTGILLAKAEALVWYPLLALALLGLVASRRRLRAIAFPVAAAGGAALLYALAEGNVGSAYRHRGEVVWVVVLLATVGLHALFQSRSGARTSPSPALVRSR